MAMEQQLDIEISEMMDWEVESANNDGLEPKEDTSSTSRTS